MRWLDQPQRRGWLLVIRHATCKDAESTYHILLHCDKARVLWKLMFSLFDIPLIIFVSIRETLLGWNGSFVDRRRKKAWKATPLCIFWIIWKERNWRLLENKMSNQRLKSSFLNNLSLWIKVYIDGSTMSLLVLVL